MWGATGTPHHPEQLARFNSLYAVGKAFALVLGQYFVDAITFSRKGPLLAFLPHLVREYSVMLQLLVRHPLEKLGADSG